MVWLRDEEEGICNINICERVLIGNETAKGYPVLVDYGINDPGTVLAYFKEKKDANEFLFNLLNRMQARR